MSSEMSEKLLIGCVAENDEKYLSQAVRLVRSLRWFGGLLGAADFVVCAVEGIERAYRDELENLGAAIRIVPRFDQTNPLFNKIQLFRLPDVGRYETLLYLDCDTIIARDPSPYLSNSTLRIKMADVPTVSTEALERVCGYFGLRPPERRYRTTQDQTPTIWYCNAGVISCPVRFIPRLIPAWCEFELAFSANPDLLGPYQHHRSQAGLALAFIADPVPFEELPVVMNFPLHLTHIESTQEMAESDPVILHYHHLVDSAGYLLPSPYPASQRRIEEFNNRLRATSPGEAKKASGDVSPDRFETEIIRNDNTALKPFEIAAANDLKRLDGERRSPRAEPVVVCIAGMHRSGTSMIARMIQSCGVYLGPERELAEPFPDNENGFWENREFVKLNEALLRELGGSWDTPPRLPDSFNTGKLGQLRGRAQELIDRLGPLKQWGWKDPRNSLTLPFWRQLIPNLKVVICLRNPLAVLQSLVRRGSPPDESLVELWLTYNKALMAIPPEDRVITHYAVYFHTPQQELRRVLELLGLSASDDTIERACSVVSWDLRHQRLANEELRAVEIPDHVVKHYLEMCSEAGRFFQERPAAVADGPRRNYLDILRLIRLETEIEAREKLLQAREEEIASLQTKLETQTTESEKAVKLLQAGEEEIASLQTQLETQTTESEREIQALQTRVTEKQAELDKITNTLGWRLLSRYGRIKHRFLIPAYRFLRPNASDGKR